MFGELRLLVQLVVGMVFLLSSGSKLTAPRNFFRGVGEYELLPPYLVQPFGVVVILSEAWLAVTHLTGWLLIFAAPIGFALLTSFVTAVGINLRRGRNVSCHCFGVQSDETISWRTISRLLLLLGCEIILIASSASSSASLIVYPRQVRDIRELSLVLFWTVFSLLAGNWVLHVDQLYDLLLGHTQEKKQSTSRRGLAPGEIVEGSR